MYVDILNATFRRHNQIRHFDEFYLLRQMYVDIPNATFRRYNQIRHFVEFKVGQQIYVDIPNPTFCRIFKWSTWPIKMYVLTREESKYAI